MPTEWSHDGLSDDLAKHLKSVPNVMVWEDIQLGPSGSPRPDVYLMHKSYVRPNPIVYECKVSRPDFLSDVTSGKWISYLNYAYAVYFAAPAGLIDKKELPDKCGLIIRGEAGWKAIKKTIFDPRPLPEKALIKLLIDGVKREGQCQRHDFWTAHYRNEAFDKKFGLEAARWVSDAAGIKERVEHANANIQKMYEKAEKQTERIREQAITDMPGLWNQLCNVLGLQENAQTHEIHNAIHELRKLKTDTCKGALKNVIGMLERVVNNNRHYIQDAVEGSGE